MPMYDFECQGCGKRFTELSSYDHRDDICCPDCQGATRVMVASFAMKSGGGASAGAVSAPSRGFS